MMLEVLRLLLGLSIAIFHRPLAGKIMEQERALDTHLRRRGVYLPPPLSDSTAQNLYFGIGIFVAVVQTVRIWLSLKS
jgi:hypothetical protein